MGENKMLYEIKNLQSRAGTGENQRGEKGRGGMARGGRKGCPSISPLRAGKTYTLLDAEGSGMVRRIWFTFPPNDPMAMRCIILRIYWDGQEQPSVEVPMGDFFGLPHGVNRDLQSEYIQVNAGTAYNCWIPMPFRKHCWIEIENRSEADYACFYRISCAMGDVPADAAYFHAQFRRQRSVPAGQNYVIVDGVQGKGHYVGTAMFAELSEQPYWWGEGEVKIWVDENGAFPTICGTGTEDYFGGSYGFGNDIYLNRYQTFSGLYTGLYAILGDTKEMYNHQKRFMLYRWHVKDPVYFDEDFKMTIDNLGWTGPRYDDYTSVAYWYQTEPKPVPFTLPEDKELIME